MTKILTMFMALLAFASMAFAATLDQTITVAAGATAETNTLSVLRGGMTIDHIALQNSGPVAATFVLSENAAGFDQQILSTNLSAGATVTLYPTRTTNAYYTVERITVTSTISSATNAVPIRYFIQSR